MTVALIAKGMLNLTNGFLKLFVTLALILFCIGLLLGVVVLGFYSVVGT